jgi:hypothetical protein
MGWFSKIRTTLSKPKKNTDKHVKKVSMGDTAIDMPQVSERSKRSPTKRSKSASDGTQRKRTLGPMPRAHSMVKTKVIARQKSTYLNEHYESGIRKKVVASDVVYDAIMQIKVPGKLAKLKPSEKEAGELLNILNALTGQGMATRNNDAASTIHFSQGKADAGPQDSAAVPAKLSEEQAARLVSELDAFDADVEPETIEYAIRIIHSNQEVSDGWDSKMAEACAMLDELEGMVRQPRSTESVERASPSQALIGSDPISQDANDDFTHPSVSLDEVDHDGNYSDQVIEDALSELRSFDEANTDVDDSDDDIQGTEQPEPAIKCADIANKTTELMAQLDKLTENLIELTNTKCIDDDFTDTHDDSDADINGAEQSALMVQYQDIASASAALKAELGGGDITDAFDWLDEIDSEAKMGAQLSDSETTLRRLQGELNNGSTSIKEPVSIDDDFEGWLAQQSEKPIASVAKETNAEIVTKGEDGINGFPGNISNDNRLSVKFSKSEFDDEIDESIQRENDRLTALEARIADLDALLAKNPDNKPEENSIGSTTDAVDLSQPVSTSMPSNRTSTSLSEKVFFDNVKAKRDKLIAFDELRLKISKAKPGDKLESNPTGLTTDAVVIQPVPPSKRSDEKRKTMIERSKATRSPHVIRKQKAGSTPAIPQVALEAALNEMFTSHRVRAVSDAVTTDASERLKLAKAKFSAKARGQELVSSAVNVRTNDTIPEKAEEPAKRRILVREKVRKETKQLRKHPAATDLKSSEPAGKDVWSSLYEVLEREYDASPNILPAWKDVPKKDISILQENLVSGLYAPVNNPKTKDFWPVLMDQFAKLDWNGENLDSMMAALFGLNVSSPNEASSAIAMAWLYVRENEWRSEELLGGERSYAVRENPYFSIITKNVDQYMRKHHNDVHVKFTANKPVAVNINSNLVFEDIANWFDKTENDAKVAVRHAP